VRRALLTWLGLGWGLVGFAAPTGDPAGGANTGGALRTAPAGCGDGPILFVDRGDPLRADDALRAIRGTATAVVVPSFGPWRDATLICAGAEPWLWMWRDDGEGPVTGLFPVTDDGFGAGVTLDGRWVDPRPSPSGASVALREDGGEGAQTLVDLAARRSRPLGYGGAVADAAWLPGRDTLVVLVDAEQGPTLTIWDPSSRAPAKDVVIGGKHARPGTLAVSPDGTRAAFAVGGARPGLRVVALGSGAVVNVPGPGGRPVWSPSSRALAAVGHRDGDRELVVWRAHTGEARRDPVPYSLLGAIRDGDDDLTAVWLDEERLLVGSRHGAEPVRVLRQGHLRALPVPDLALDGLVRTPNGALWTVDDGALWRIRPTGRAERVRLPVEAEAVTVRPDGAVLVVAEGGEAVVRASPGRR
jgi:hypothetical protein